MKKLFILFALAIVADTSLASTWGWNCLVSDRRNEPVVESLRLPGYLPTIGVLTISDVKCKQIGPAIYSDFCVLNNSYAVGIGINPQRSELLSRNGRKIGLSCERGHVVGPQPSHGGSIVR